MKTLLVSFVLLVISTLSILAEGEPTVTTDSEPPSGEILFSHYNGEESGGWGWYNLPAVFRHVGQSFRVPTDADVSKITFSVRRMAGGAIQEQPYALRLIEVESPAQRPEDGQIVAAFDGFITLAEDLKFFLTFTLPAPVTVRSGAYYIITLEWRNPLPANHLELSILKNYGSGSLWEHSEKTEDTYRRITDSTQPGLVMFLQ